MVNANSTSKRNDNVEFSKSVDTHTHTHIRKPRIWHALMHALL